MADPLSPIAGLIAVAQISGTIISICYDYRRGLKNASSSVMRLADEVKSLRDVIESLIKIVDEQQSKASNLPTIELLAHEDGPLTQCLKELEDLQVKLQPAIGWKAINKALKWPLSEPELTKVLTRLNRLKTTLLVAMSADQLSVSTVQT